VYGVDGHRGLGCEPLGMLPERLGAASAFFIELLAMVGPTFGVGSLAVSSNLCQRAGGVRGHLDHGGCPYGRRA
jgi:hypothetical protein